VQQSCCLEHAGKEPGRQSVIQCWMKQFKGTSNILQNKGPGGLPMDADTVNRAHETLQCSPGKH